MRILAGNPALSLDKLGFDPGDYNKIIDAINAPQGMVLVTVRRVQVKQPLCMVHCKKLTRRIPVF